MAAGLVEVRLGKSRRMPWSSLEDLAPGYTVGGEDIGAWAQRQRTAAVRAELEPGQVRQLDRLGNMLKDLGQVRLWLSAEGLAATDLNEERLAKFLAARLDTGCRRVPGIRGIVPLLSYLREIGMVAAIESPPTPLIALPERYRSRMETERGLAPATVLRYENAARRFLAEQAMTDGAFTPERLGRSDINAWRKKSAPRSTGTIRGRDCAGGSR